MENNTEIKNQAVEEPARPTVSFTYVSTHSPDYPQLYEFKKRMESVRWLGIIAWCLFFGIGIIFSIIAKCMIGELPNAQWVFPEEIAEFQYAKKKYDFWETWLTLHITLMCIAIFVFFCVLANVM